MKLQVAGIVKKNIYSVNSGNAEIRSKRQDSATSVSRGVSLLLFFTILIFFWFVPLFTSNFLIS